MFIRHPPRQKPNPSPPLESPPPSQQGRRHTASSPTTPLPESMTRKLWASESPPPLVSVDNDSSDEAEKHNSGDSAAGGFFSRTFARFKSTFSNNFGTFSQPFPRSFTDTFSFVASSSPSSGLDTADAGGNWDLRVRPHLRPAVTTATTSCLRQVRERGSLGDIPFSPKLEGRNHETPKVLTKAIAREIQQHVPRRIRLARTWRLLYSLEQHGTSIRTLYKRVERKGPVLLAIKDTRGHVFGAYLSDPPRIEPNFYGNGTCFLWRAYRAPFGEKRKLLEEDDDDDGAEVKEKGGRQDNNSPSRAVAVRVYNSTGDNQYFIYCQPDAIAIGGGRGKFGLWFDGEFTHGHTCRCPAFNNEVLCLDSDEDGGGDEDEDDAAAKKSREVDKKMGGLKFTPLNVEIWGFDRGY